MIILPQLNDGDEVMFHSSVNTRDTMISYSVNKPVLRVKLRSKVSYLPEVVKEKTGFQDIVKDKVTSSTAEADTILFSTSIGSSIKDRMSRSVPGYLEPLNLIPGGNSSTGSVRGPNTIRGNMAILFVVENQVIPDPDMINPNDIESIMVSRDAPLLAMYGVRGANGIVIIKLKNSKTNKLRVSITSQFTFMEPPDLYRKPVIAVEDYIRLEEQLFKDNVYASRERDQLPLSPVVEALIRHREGRLSQNGYDSLIAQYGQQDIRRDLAKYQYRSSFSQQHHVNISTGYKRYKLYASIGHNTNTFPQQGNAENRTTLHTSTHYTNDKWAWHSRYFLTVVNQQRSLFEMPVAIPYLTLADQHNNAMAIPYFKRNGYLDTLAGGRYFDWQLRPLEEWRSSGYRSNLSYLSFNQTVVYRPSKRIQLNAMYQYTATNRQEQWLYRKESFVVRNEMNQHGKLDGGVMYWGLPYGDRLDSMKNKTHIHSGRIQADYNWERNNISLSSIIGGEFQLIKSYYTSKRYYAFGTVNQKWVNNFPAFDSTGVLGGLYQSNTLDFNEQLVFSLSFRNDQSNSYGPKSLLKGPFYSVGSMIHLHKFSFYPGSLPAFSLRASFGETGNSYNQLLKSTTVRNAEANIYGQPVSVIDNSGNAQLSAERWRSINIGGRIAARDSSYTISFDYYWKKSKSLYGIHEVNPTAGFSYIMDNNSSLSGHGFDLSAELRYGNQQAQQTTQCWLSYNINRITSHELSLNEAWKYASLDFYKPQQGYPVNAIFAFPLSTLDSATGDPVGYLDGKPSKDAKAIIESKNPATIKFIGSAIPLYYGCLTHRLQVKKLVELTIQISGRFNYFYRSPSYKSSEIIAGTGIHPDFNFRWQKPGDEKTTAILAFRPVPDLNKERLYEYSEENVRPADQVRLEFIQLGIAADQRKFDFLPCKSIFFYCTVSNLGILWRKNKLHQDPDAVQRAFPVPRTISFTIKVNF
jgi:hypothetical protein